jgi:hypothetical protein
LLDTRIDESTSKPVEAADGGQVDVEDHEIGRGVGNLAQCARAVDGVAHLEPFPLEPVSDERPDHVVVVDDEDDAPSSGREGGVGQVGVVRRLRAHDSRVSACGRPT